MFRCILRSRSCHSSVSNGGGLLDEREVVRALEEAGRRGATVEEAMARFRGRISSRLVDYVFYRCNFGSTPAAENPATKGEKKAAKTHLAPTCDAAYEFFKWTEKQQQFRHTVHTYTCLLKYFVKCGQVSRAMQFFHEELRPNCLPNRFAYTVLIKGVSADRHYNWQALLYLFGEMKQAGAWPNVNTYNILFKGLCDRGMVGRAMTKFGRMSRWCIPDLVTYNTMIKGLCINDRLDWAIFLFQRMIACEDIKMSRQGDRSIVRASYLFTALPQDLVEPDGFTYSTLIHGLCKERRFDDGVVIFDKMLERKFRPDTAVFNTIVNGLCKGGRLSQALDILKRMLELGYEPDVVTYSTVISGACRKRKFKHAYHLFQQMIDSNCPPNLITFNTMIYGLSKQSQVEEIELLLKQMRDCGLQPDEYTYNDLMFALVRRGQVDEAKAVFLTAMNENLKPDRHMYTTLIKGYSRAGRLDEALIVFEDMKRKCVPHVRAYNLLLDALCAVENRFSEAMQLFEEMIRVRCSPNRQTFQLMVAGMIKSGNTDKFDKVFMDMVYRGRFAKMGPLIE